MSINLITGQEESEIDPATGLPRVKDPVAMPNVAPILDQQGGAGGAAAPPGAVVAQSVLPPAAAHEEQTTTTLPTAQDRAADAALTGARSERDTALQAQDAAKQTELQIKAEEATANRIRAEKEAEQLRIADAKVQELTDRNLQADKQMRDESAAEEKRKLTPPRVRDGLEIFATVLATIGQGFASVTEGSKVWAQGNPVAKMYEKKRADEIARALEQFQASERYRKLKKEGRDDELAAAEAELRIGITNRWARDGKVAASVADEKLAKAGPAAQKAGTALTLGMTHVLDATAERENAKDYRIKHSVTDREQPAEDKRAFAGREDVESDTAAAADIAALEKLKEDIQKNPSDFKHVVDTRARFADISAQKERLAKLPAVGPGLVAGAATIDRVFGDDAVSKTSGDQLLDTKKFQKSPDLWTGIEEMNGVKARTYGGVIQEGDRKASEAAAALAARSPEKTVQYIDTLLGIRRKQLETLRGVKKGLGESEPAISPLHEQIRGRFPSPAPAAPAALPVAPASPNVGFGGTLRSQINERLNGRRKKDERKQ